MKLLRFLEYLCRELNTIAIGDLKFSYLGYHLKEWKTKQAKLRKIKIKSVKRKYLR